MIEGRFDVGNGTQLSCIPHEPLPSTALLVLARGAGADMRHAGMAAIAETLAPRRIATLRFNFPFMEEGNKRVNARPVATAAIAAAFVTRVC